MGDGTLGMSLMNKTPIRELVCFEQLVLRLNLVSSKINNSVYKWIKETLQINCDETIWMGLVEPTKEHSWSLIRELLN